ncbi:hypothetical protein [Metabacillus arenae]|nr:hypothetical protein [Metabacillus arenae]
MKKENEPICNEKVDYLHHFLNEQITQINVIEEEERIREENQQK